MTQGSVAAIILAAGASTRLGEPKQLVRIGAQTLLERALATALEASCTPVRILLGAHAETIRGHLTLPLGKETTILINEGWREGMASSLRLGIVSLADEPVTGAVIMTCDQPFCTAAHLKALASRAPQAVTASAYAGRKGVPAYFPAHTFQELLTLRGDEGARGLLRQAEAIDLPGGELDVDTPEALATLRLRLRELE